MFIETAIDRFPSPFAVNRQHIRNCQFDIKAVMENNVHRHNEKRSGRAEAGHKQINIRKERDLAELSWFEWFCEVLRKISQTCLVQTDDRRGFFKIY